MHVYILWLFCSPNKAQVIHMPSLRLPLILNVAAGEGGLDIILLNEWSDIQKCDFIKKITFLLKGRPFIIQTGIAAAVWRAPAESPRSPARSLLRILN